MSAPAQQQQQQQQQPADDERGVDSRNRGDGGDDKPVVREQVRSTGSSWGDFKLAAQRISPSEDVRRLGEMPCARNSLLMGIGAGAGIGVVRGLNAKPLVAANWAVGTFVAVSVGMWNICQANIRRERAQVRVVVEQMAERRRRAGAEGSLSDPIPSPNPNPS